MATTAEHTGVSIGRLTRDATNEHWAVVIISCSCCGEWVLRFPAVHTRNVLLRLLDLHEDRPDLTTAGDEGEQGE